MANGKTAVVLSNGQMRVGGKLQVTPSGLKVDGKLSFEEWQEAGRFFRFVDECNAWSIGDWLRLGERDWGDKYWAAALDLGFSQRTLEDYKYVADNVHSTFRNVNLLLGHHKAVAPLGDDPGEQKRWLDLAEQGGGEKRWTVAEMRAAMREERLRLTREANPFPDGKCRVLYADPPWKYADDLIEGYGAAEHHYPTLTLQELCDLADGSGRKVAELAAEDAALFLWTTSPLLDDAFGVVSAWGFQYKSSFVWDKVRHNYGHYNSVRHELLLVCTRGSCTPDAKTLRDSVVECERSDEHSEKPAVFYEIIEEMYDHGPRLELFARRARAGWDAWGNEAGNRGG
jgi:N6-adenosine-specific RNA methylase IME4